jgi:hypothetical protein
MTDPSPSPDPLLLQFLCARDIPCPSCAYNLRDLTGDRCPECGQEITLRLQLAEPKLAAMLTGLIGLSTGAGFNGLLLIYWAIIRFYVQPGGMDNSFLWVIIVGFLVHAVALAAWLRYWKPIRRTPPRVRWALAGACCAAPLVDIVIFSLTIL